MSLRLRLNLLLGLLSAAILLIGGGLIVHNAKRAVQAEMSSTAQLAINLLEAALVGAGDRDRVEGALLRRLGSLDTTRHLSVQIRSLGNALWELESRSTSPLPPAPRWFARLVGVEPLTLRRLVEEPGQQPIELLVRARPRDEIAEAWEEAQIAFALLLLLSVLSLGIVSIAIGRALAPVGAILGVLEALGRSDYSARVDTQTPAGGGSELSRIALKVNQLAGTLEASVARARELARRTLDIQEQERRYLAHELHDEMGQSLSAIRALAVSMSSEATAAQEIRDSARTIGRVAGETYDTVRGMMHRLRPPALDELGMLRALEQLVTDWNAHHAPAHCTLTCDSLDTLPGEDTDIHLYRIVQEALTNVARHASARRVSVDVVGRDGRVEVTICDDGCGFDPRGVREGLGLIGMRERVNAMLGELGIESTAKRGTCIRVIVPI